MTTILIDTNNQYILFKKLEFQKANINKLKIKHINQIYIHAGLGNAIFHLVFSLCIKGVRKVLTHLQLNQIN